jgi:hypothetical protein
MATEHQLHKANRIVKTTNIAWAIFGVLVGLPAAFMGATVLDAPGSEKQLSNVLLAMSMTTLPLVCAFSIVVSRKALRAESLPRTYFWALLPFVNLAYIAAWMATLPR